MISHATDRTLLMMARQERAERNLLDYKPPGYVITTAAKLMLAEFIGQGFDPSDAASMVQERTWRDDEHERGRPLNL